MYPYSNRFAHASAASPTIPLLPPEPAAPALVIQPDTGAVAKAEPPAHIPALTHEDVARNDLSLRALPAHLQDIEKFVPELQKKKPPQILEILSERYVADPRHRQRSERRQLGGRRPLHVGSVADRRGQAHELPEQDVPVRRRAGPHRHAHHLRNLLCGGPLLDLPVRRQSG